MVLLPACRQQNNTAAVINKEDIPALARFFRNKIDHISVSTPVDSAVHYFTELGNCYKKQDSLEQWVTLNYNAYNLIYDTFNNVFLAGRFLDSIIANDKLLKDSVTEKILMRSYFYKGYDLGTMGEHSQSIPLLEKFLLLGVKYDPESKNLLASGYSRLGNAFIRQGDNIKGRMFLLKSFEIFKTINNPFGYESARAQCVNIANVYNQMGEYAIAINYADTGLSIANTTDSSRTAYLLAVKAESYTGLGVPDEAFTLAQKGLKILPPGVDDYWERNAELQAVIANSIQEKNKTGAIAFYRSSVISSYKAFNTIRRREVGKKFYGLAECYRQLNNSDSAIHYYHRALYTVANIDTNNIFSLPRKEDLYAENTIMEALDAKAAWMTNYFSPKEKLKHWQCAIDCYDLAFEVERKLLLNFSYDESKIRMLKDSRQRSEKAIALCYKLYQETNDNQWVEKAFRFAERNKAFIVLESIKRNLAASQTAQNDTIFQKVQQLQLEYAYAERSLLEARNTGDTLQLKQWEETKNKTDEQLQLAKTALFQYNAGYRQWMEQEDSVSISMARQLLPDKQTLLVEYFIGDTSSYAIIVSGKRSHLVAVSNEHIATIDSFRFFFRDKNSILADPGGYQRTANNVYNNWLRPCLEGFSGNELLIIPDDRLSLLPFDALVTSVSTSNNLQSWTYLVKEYQVSTGYSVSTLLKQNHRQVNTSGRVAFAPGFINGERGLPALPFTFEEIDNSKTSSKTLLYKNNEASLARFKKYASGSSEIHIASHARANESKEIPAIEFADGFLLLNELYAMPVNADLVVLSACQTGIGKIEKSEGPMSLARGFYYAGAKNIITSLWNINDRSTAILFKNFYRYSDKGKYSLALHKAKMDYLSAKLTNDKYSPYYWAGFICIGADERRENNKWLWLGGFALAMAILLWGIHRRNKGRLKKQ